jgi:hypothetical protein
LATIPSSRSIAFSPLQPIRSQCGLAIGVVATSAGIGIGVMHMAKSDLDMTAVAGLVALIAGLYLVVAAGGTSLVSMIRSTSGKPFFPGRQTGP